MYVKTLVYARPRHGTSVVIMTAASSRRLSRAEQRAQTRTRLLDAAEELFAQRGIAVTPIEDIAESAGFSRGAFYSNFEGKGDLVLALLERTNARDSEELDALFENSVNATDFFQRLRRREIDVHRRALSLEYVLYAMRNPEARPELTRILDIARQATARLIEAQWRELGMTLPFPLETTARVLEAVDDGLDMHRQIDPEGYPLGMFTDVLVMLQDAAVALAEKLARES